MISSLRALRSFVAIVDHGSFSAAARALNYSQPAVSLHVTALERELGCQLMERCPRSVRLTEDGHRVLVIAREVLALCAMAEKVASLDPPVVPLMIMAGSAPVTPQEPRDVAGPSPCAPGVRTPSPRTAADGSSEPRKIHDG